jgi:hypothetical protein
MAPAATTANCPGVTNVMVAQPLCPSLVAVMIAVPGATPKTHALPPASSDTLATVGLLDCHVTMRYGSTVPAASRITALSLIEPPAGPTGTLVDSGVTVTESTGARLDETITVAVPAL